jgi:hypothetical protein
MTTFTGAGIAGGSNVGQFSPFVVFTNPNVSNGTTNETLFFSEESTPKSGCSGASANGDGCIYAYPVTGSSGVLGTPASTSEHGYTSGLIIDNVSTSAQASSIYFASEATTGASNSAPNCTYTSSGTAAYCAVKLTQSGLK